METISDRKKNIKHKWYKYHVTCTAPNFVMKDYKKPKYDFHKL